MKRVMWLFLIFPLSLHATSFFKGHREGWFWYQEPKEEGKKKENGTATIASNPTEEMLAFRKEVEDSLNLAILYPTGENLKNYAAKYFEVIKKGQRFTDAYKVMLLKSPEFDYSLKFPTNYLTQSIQYAQQKNALEYKVKQFVKSYGFFLFVAGSCPFCHAFAPVVREFKEKYGASLVPISLDGGAFPDFPKVVSDNGTAKAFNVTHLPALFAVNPKKNEAIPIANGVLSLSELEENIIRIVELQHE